MNGISEAQLPLEVISQRRRDLVFINYTGLAFAIKGAIIAIAGWVFVQLVSDFKLPFYSTRLLMWAASFGFSIVTLITWLRGVLFASAAISAFDFILPLLIGMVEVVMFLILPAPIQPVQGIWLSRETFWMGWYLALGVHAICASLMVFHRQPVTSPSQFGTSNRSRGLAINYKNWILIDSISAFLIAIFCFSMVVFSIYYNTIYFGLSTAGIILRNSPLLLLNGMALFITIKTGKEFNKPKIIG